MLALHSNGLLVRLGGEVVTVQGSRDDEPD